MTHIRDGDTFEVSGVPVRIANLDCAERGTVAGDNATALMRRIASSATVSCSSEGRRSYDRGDRLFATSQVSATSARR